MPLKSPPKISPHPSHLRIGSQVSKGSTCRRLVLPNLVIAKLEEIVRLPLFEEGPDVVADRLASRFWKSTQFTFHVAEGLLSKIEKSYNRKCFFNLKLRFFLKKDLPVSSGGSVSFQGSPI